MISGINCCSDHQSHDGCMNREEHSFASLLDWKVPFSSGVDRKRLATSGYCETGVAATRRIMRSRRQ